MAPQDRARLENDHWIAGLAPARRQAVLENLVSQGFPPGAYLYRMGDPPNGLHCVLEGEVRLVDYGGQGAETVAIMVRPVFWIGEVSVIDGLERPHDAVTATPVRIARLSMAAIAALTHEDPGFWRDLGVLACAHQRMGLRRAARLQTEPAMVRLARHLAAAAAHEPGGAVRVTQQDLAHAIGVSRQRINVLLGELEAMGLASCSYRLIRLPDRGGLYRLITAHAEA